MGTDVTKKRENEIFLAVVHKNIMMEHHVGQNRMRRISLAPKGMTLTFTISLTD